MLADKSASATSIRPERLIRTKSSGTDDENRIGGDRALSMTQEQNANFNKSSSQYRIRVRTKEMMASGFLRTRRCRD